MGKRSGSSNTKMATSVAMGGGVFLLRKLLAVTWTKVTGKTPPTDLTDPEVTLVEALAWALATGLIVETARFLIIRSTMRRLPGGSAEPS